MRSEGKDGQKRQTVEIVADTVEFLAAPSGGREPSSESLPDRPLLADDVPF